MKLVLIFVFNKNNIFLLKMQRLPGAHAISRYYSLRWKSVSRYQYKVEFVVTPLMVLALYCSVFCCMCCLFGFHLGTCKKSDALCVALLSFTSVERVYGVRPGPLILRCYLHSSHWNVTSASVERDVYVTSASATSQFCCLNVTSTWRLRLPHQSYSAWKWCLRLLQGFPALSIHLFMLYYSYSFSFVLLLLNFV